jgi:acyl-CoA thioester hydrolase
VSAGFVASVPVRWSDIDMYSHVNHATMVTILEEARLPFLSPALGADITSTGLLVAEVRVR